MLQKLKDILNTYTFQELEEIDLWVNSDYRVEQLIIDEYSIDLITEDRKVEINKE